MIEEQYKRGIHDDEENYRIESNDNYNVKNSQTLERELTVHKRPQRNRLLPVKISDD